MAREAQVGEERQSKDLCLLVEHREAKKEGPEAGPKVEALIFFRRREKRHFKMSANGIRTLQNRPPSPPPSR